MVFPVVMYGCESWTMKKAECQRIDAFKSWCWRRLFRFPWTLRRSNQSILRETNPEYSLEGLMLKLKLQYFGHLMWQMTCWKSSWCWERLGQRMRCLGGITDAMNMNVGKLGDGEGWGGLTCCSPWSLKESDMIGWLNNTRERTCTLTC